MCIMFAKLFINRMSLSGARQGQRPCSIPKGFGFFS